MEILFRIRDILFNNGFFQNLRNEIWKMEKYIRKKLRHTKCIYLN